MHCINKTISRYYALIVSTLQIDIIHWIQLHVFEEWHVNILVFSIDKQGNETSKEIRQARK